jgi:small subunit ribosomal protein S24e
MRPVSPKEDDTMEIEIKEKRDNPLLDRTDVWFVVRHDGEKTPQRDRVKSELAKAVGAKADVTVIDHIESEYGISASRGYAKVYKTVEKARYHERRYIQKRNNLLVEEKKKEEGA